MKTFKAICAAWVIALSLTIPAYAEDPSNPGDAHQPGGVNPTGGPGTPPRVPGTPGANGETTPMGGDGFPTLADILLALVRIL